MSGVATFRWKRYDGSEREWSAWHHTDGPCPACCCADAQTCGQCGGREHHEPVDGGREVVHSYLCEGCREGDDGDPAEIEEQR